MPENLASWVAGGGKEAILPGVEVRKKDRKKEMHKGGKKKGRERGFEEGEVVYSLVPVSRRINSIRREVGGWRGITCNLQAKIQATIII